MHVKVGPCGGESGGEVWDEKGRTKIAKILITYGSNCIKSLQFQYVENGKSLLSELPGEYTGPNFKMVTLDHDDEYIIGLTGTYSSSTVKTRYVNSLTIETNVNKYGPFRSDSDGESSDGYGESSDGLKFSLEFGPDNHFGGFHGRSSNDRLISIGVYVNLLSAREIIHAGRPNLMMWRSIEQHARVY